MIVKRESPPNPFRPVTITLETQEEVDLIWNLLNISSIDEVVKAVKKRHAYFEHPYSIDNSTRMYITFNNAIS